jgi:stage II sporulation protein D
MRVVAPVFLAALLWAAPAQAADLVVDGRGWGHGVGLSQYGAYGYALREGRDHRFILGHFYPGTDVGRAASTGIRVRLKRAGTLRVCGATRARDAGGRSVRLSEARTYVFAPLGPDRLAVSAGGRRRARLRAPVSVSGGTSTCLRGGAENGVRDGAYHGRMVLARDGAGLLAVNELSLEHYLYGVVPGEMPSSWPAEALAAQAVIARSYAIRSLRPTAAFDVYADVRSQMYRGVAGEAASTTAAVRATRARVVVAGGEVAQTFYFSTSGGRTSANEDEWGGAPISYLRSVEDPHDDLSPYHTWEVRLRERDVRRRLRGLTPGDYEGLAVASRTASGRAATVDIVGSGGTNTVPAATIRTRLGLRSTWFSVG